MPAYPPIKTSGDVDIVTQLPYTESDEFPVVTEELECGKGYALNWYTGPQPRVFTLRYTVMEREELTVIEDFFRLMRGRLGSFTFDDHEGVTWSDCRFDQDELRVEYTGICQYALEVKLKSIR